MPKRGGGNVSVRVVGLEELFNKLDAISTVIVAPCARRFMMRAGYLVQADASKLAPHDRGWLRNDINVEVDPSPLPRWVKIGTGSKTRPYAQAVEFGSKPHWPPPGPLAAWMTRNNMDPGVRKPGSIYLQPGEFQVARKIAKKGTKAQPFLRPALRKNRVKIDRLVSVMADEIERAAENMR